MAVGETLHVRWRLGAGETPMIWRRCRRCNGESPFASSDKFRANAQKKRLDVWLIYRCQRCGETWNRPVIERRPVAQIDPTMLQAITENDRQMARSIAGGPSAADGNVTVDKLRTAACPRDPSQVAITLELEAASDLRLDRLLARELKLSRSALRRLCEEGLLDLLPSVNGALRRPARDGQEVRIHLRRLDPSLAAEIIGRV
ncbi:MAG: DUF1062 domain-containing protein [Pseudomonadota bacterium]